MTFEKGQKHKSEPLCLEDGACRTPLKESPVPRVGSWPALCSTRAQLYRLCSHPWKSKSAFVLWTQTYHLLKLWSSQSNTHEGSFQFSFSTDFKPDQDVTAEITTFIKLIAKNMSKLRILHAERSYFKYRKWEKALKCSRASRWVHT